eukprot:CAMPEP_0173066228 /NCGR_PEP_ID=MMETSP1102-20130122/6078_1 /TAXON_ID=49646 /ORGANISM="Geminigera sp., Strain Caron Lab Isolate" /LENGTH=53 /DNA_ID=CAMNT_0013933629 /DNA_START=151 /DNA_END=313 /DNA_ORIENTATION=-
MPMSPGPIRQAFSDPEPTHEAVNILKNLYLAGEVAVEEQDSEEEKRFSAASAD